MQSDQAQQTIHVRKKVYLREDAFKSPTKSWPLINLLWELFAQKTSVSLINGAFFKYWNSYCFTQRSRCQCSPTIFVCRRSKLKSWLPQFRARQNHFKYPNPDPERTLRKYFVLNWKMRFPQVASTSFRTKSCTAAWRPVFAKFVKKFDASPVNSNMRTH
jgi:hypothetical protein